MKNNKFNVIYIKEKDWIVARCLEIDVVSQGKTQRSAERNIKEAISLYLESFEDQQIPEYKTKPVIKKITIPNNAATTKNIGKRVNKVSGKTGFLEGAAKRKPHVPAKTLRR
jgi:predicted RNase H-like HicB family nuclease